MKSLRSYIRKAIPLRASTFEKQHKASIKQLTSIENSIIAISSEVGRSNETLFEIEESLSARGIRGEVASTQFDAQLALLRAHAQQLETALSRGATREQISRLSNQFGVLEAKVDEIIVQLGEIQKELRSHDEANHYGPDGKHTANCRQSQNNTERA